MLDRIKRINFINLYDKWKQKRDEQIISLLEKNPDARVIDLGCGKGEFTIEIQEKIGCREIYGVDVWDEGIKKAREKGMKVIKSDLNKNLSIIAESFDVVISNQVLEHLWFPIQFIKNVRRILKPSGYAVISTENLSSWDNIAALIFGYTPFSMQFDGYLKIGNPLSPHEKEKFDKYPPHTRIFTYKGLKQILEELDLKVEDVKGSGYLPFNFISSIDTRHSRFLTLKVVKV